MASSLPLLPPLADTLSYFAKYNYPLTPDELWYWQHGTRFSKLKIEKLIKNLKLKIENWEIRNSRKKYSTAKWTIAQRVGDSLARIPTIAAIFVTGALAMDNCPKDDDIDLMIVTYPNCLWPTRFFVNLLLWPIRRFPEHRPSNTEHHSNQICPNLWLDSENLKLKTENLYIAHEILQAKCIMDRCNIHHRFLQQNSWASKFLPIAYKESLKKLKFENLNLIENYSRSATKLIFKIKNFILWPLNLLFFAAQYAYMLPKKTTERVAPGFAFFHPKKI